MNPVREGVQTINKLADALNRHDFIRRFDQEGEPQAGMLAHSLVDLDGSFRKISNELLPILIRQAADENAAKQTLWAIGEELRHIIYHLKSTAFFQYLETDR